jgi:hypothetical protein
MRYAGLYHGAVVRERAAFSALARTTLERAGQGHENVSGALSAVRKAVLVGRPGMVLSPIGRAR